MIGPRLSEEQIVHYQCAWLGLDLKIFGKTFKLIIYLLNCSRLVSLLDKTKGNHAVELGVPDRYCCCCCCCCYCYSFYFQ